MTRVTVSNSLRNVYVDTDRLSKPVGLHVSPIWYPQTFTPPGYHWSGRYMPLQGGSKTRIPVRRAYLVDPCTGDRIRVTPLPHRFDLKERLSDYFDRISQ